MIRCCLPVLAGCFAVSAVAAATVRETFATDPALAGWQVYGDTNFFQWNPTNHVLDVTWDSTQTNSFFYYPLGRTYTLTNSFCVQFDLRLNDATATGYGSELAVGLFRFADATNPDYVRTYGTLPNLCEFDYFPPDDYGDSASMDGTLIDAATYYYFAYDNQLITTGMTYQVRLTHLAGSTVIAGEVFTNGQLMTTLPESYANGTGDFQLDTLAVSSYLGSGFGDILAHGTVSNLAFASPLPIGLIQMEAGQVTFLSDTNWQYTLEASTDLQTWSPAAPAVIGNGTNLWLQPGQPPADHAFFRVTAVLP
jgi:hypothetical protein